MRQAQQQRPLNIASTDMYRAILDRLERRDAVALAVVLNTEGSTPRETGVRAIIDSAGSIVGTIGGGAVEAMAQRRAMEAIASNQALVFDFKLEGARVKDAAPICGGTMRVLLDPAAADHQPAFAQAAQAREQRERGILMTTVRHAVPLRITVEWFAENSISPNIGFPGADAISSVLIRETPELFIQDSDPQGHRVEVLVEPVIPKPLLLIAGGGHIGQALAVQASLVGFEIMVVDDRPEFTNPALFPDGTQTRCADIAKSVGAFRVARDTYIVIVTRGHQFDAGVLAACIQKPAAYLGMIGSRRKVAILRQEFLESGRATADQWDRVHAPIGLDIGATTVPEIAASIVAQLIAVRRKGAASRIPPSAP